ncbi:MAG: tobH protein [Mycobacteriaceae bacterium]
MVTTFVDLDDGEALLAADSEAHLRACALAGAQVRSIAAAISEGVLATIAQFRPRSLIIVAAKGMATRAAIFVSAAVSSRCSVPLVISSTTPTWAGALDLIMVVGHDAGDPELVNSVALGVRRGAEVVVSAPYEGPLREAGAGRVIVLESRISVPEAFSFLGYATAILATLATVEEDQNFIGQLDFSQLADALDREAVRSHPSREVFRNPAKLLAASMLKHRVIFSGDTSGTVALSVQCSAFLMRQASIASSTLSLSEVLSASPTMLSTGSRKAGSCALDPLFHDEQFDGPQHQLPLRVFLFSTTEQRDLVERRSASVAASVEFVTVEEAAEPELTSGYLDSTALLGVGAPRVIMETTELEQLMVLELRAELAAVYLQIVGGDA